MLTANFAVQRPAIPRCAQLSRVSSRHNRCSFKFKASLSEFPLASRIVVKNLSHFTNVSLLQEEFAQFGHIAEINLRKDDTRKNSKPYAFIQYTSQDDAMLALETMDHKYLDGQLIYLEVAKLGRSGGVRYPKASGPPQEQPKQG